MSKRPFSDWDDDEPHWSGKYKESNEPFGSNLIDKPAAKNYGSTQDIDVDKALADQYAEAEAFRDHLLNNSTAYQPNHVTGAITGVNRILEQIIKLRESVQNLARLQAIEDTVVELMKEQHESVRIAFFDQLEERIKNIA